MDPRHPQHPFSRNSASSFSHAPFQSPASQATFPPTSHPPSTTALYSESPRRTADNSYYSQSTSYPRDGAAIPSASHSRHTSTSSLNHNTPINRNMPPPLSPQQQHPQPQHAQHSHALAYPPSTLSRGPPPPLANATNFPNSRDLPSLSSVHRPSSVNSSMSISSMLGGPSDTREVAQPPSQYPAPPSIIASAPPPTSYPAPMHASPRSSVAGADYGRFRRPRTPDARIPESQGVRDRANSAGSPPGTALISTPEKHLYGTPQAYPQRAVQHQHTSSLEDRREHYPVRVPNPNSTFPPRPSSQPTSFSGPPPTLTDSTRRPADGYGRQGGYGDREPLNFQERVRHEEEIIIRKERELRERERIEHLERLERAHFQTQTGSAGPDGPNYTRQYMQQPIGPYNDPRESAPWLMRRQEQQAPEQVPVTNSYDYPRSTATSYPSSSAYSSQESRYPPNSYGQGTTQQRSSNHSQYETQIEDRARPLPADQPQQPSYQGPTQLQSGTYRLHESPRVRAAEESQQLQQRGYLGIQEINRRGRNSPFPQAVQGAQSQHTGPGGEPGIKSEFGKMFSGIGSGVGSMNTVGASSSGVQTPFSGSGQLRREDLDGLISQDSPGENGGHKLMRESSRGGRRRKLKEEDSKGDDDSSTGRHTPSGRGPKRPKPVHQSSIGLNQRHLNRRDSGDNMSSPSQPNFIPTTAQPAQSPTSIENKILVPHHHHINRHHHHHHHTAALHRSSPAPVVMPKPMRIVKSKAVLDSVAHLPRRHLGHAIYKSILESGDPPSSSQWGNVQRGFASTPYPLPRFEGQENSTFTIRVPRIHLTSVSREEITSRRALWGTDIYSDDSDIVAACIHGGWIRGEWSQDVDVSLLGLEPNSPEVERIGVTTNGISDVNEEGRDAVDSKSMRDATIEKPPARGPMMPLTDCDLHVTVLILPCLEKYSSTTRFGIMSRAWEATHDGLSFMILSIKWVHGVDTAREVSGQGRRMRMKLAIPSPDSEEESFWGSVLENGEGSNIDYGRHNGLPRESAVRGEGIGPMVELTGLGMGGWWNRRDKKKAKSTEQEVEVKVEERPTEVEQQSEATVPS